VNSDAHIQYSIVAIFTFAIAQTTIEIPFVSFLGTGLLYFYYDYKNNEKMASGEHAWAAGFTAPALLMLPYGLIGKIRKFSRRQTD